MKRARKLTKRERKGVEAEAPPCSRPLRPQLVPHAPSRTGEHPRDAVRRLDLLSNEDLDVFRAAHGDAAEAALDLAVELETTLEQHLEPLHASGALGKLRQRPTLAVFVCQRCGASDIGTDVRSGVLARTIDRTKISERELRAVEALLMEAWAPESAPALDRLPAATLLELLALVDRDVDLGTLRIRVAQRLHLDALGTE